MPYLLMTSLIWSFSFGVINAELTGLDPYLVSWIRLVLSFLVFLPFLRRVAFPTALALVAIGMIQFGLMYCLYIYSYQYLAGHQVALLTITTPLFMVLIHAVLERRWVARYWSAAVLAVLAALVLAVGESKGQPSWKGVLLVQGANLCFAAGQLFYKKLPLTKQRARRHFGWLYLGALIVPALFIALQGGDLPSLPTGERQWLALLYVGLIPSGLGFFLWNKGVVRVNAGLAAIMNNLKVPLGVLVAWLFFGEQIQTLPFLISAALFALALRLGRRS